MIKKLEKKYEDKENDYINFNDFIIPNHFIEEKNEILRKRSLRSVMGVYENR